MPREKYTLKQRLFRAALGEVLHAERLRTAAPLTQVAAACGNTSPTNIGRAERIGCGLHLAHDIATALGLPLWAVIKRAEELWEGRWAEIQNARTDPDP